ncbi:MAG: TIGR04219 family outer membrane beta-barrel protein [Chromatiales bacterium]|jgi:outer membrane protein
MKQLIPAILLTALPALATADAVDFEIAAGAWYQDISGDVQFDFGEPLDVDDLGYDKETKGLFWASLEHPVPVVPNVLIAYTPVDFQGNGFISANVGGTVFNEPVNSKLTFNQTDLTLYWKLLDNWANLDLGLTGRYVDGEVEVVGETTGQRERVTYSGPVPLVYGDVAFDLPLTGLSVGVTGQGIQYKDSSAYDVSGRVSYEFSFGFGVLVGYRKEKLDLDQDDLDGVAIDVDIDGPFGAAFFHF